MLSSTSKFNFLLETTTKKNMPDNKIADSKVTLLIYYLIMLGLKNTIFVPWHLKNFSTWLDSLTYVTLHIIHTEQFWVRQSEKKFHLNDKRHLTFPYMILRNVPGKK